MWKHRGRTRAVDSDDQLESRSQTKVHFHRYLLSFVFVSSLSLACPIIWGRRYDCLLSCSMMSCLFDILTSMLRDIHIADVATNASFAREGLLHLLCKFSNKITSLIRDVRNYSHQNLWTRWCPDNPYLGTVTMVWSTVSSRNVKSHSFQERVCRHCLT